MLVIRHGQYRAEARSHFIGGMRASALTAALRGDSPRYAAMNYSLPGCFGREYPNNAERTLIERHLRVCYNDYTHFAPPCGWKSRGNKASAYINPRYQEAS